MDAKARQKELDSITAEDLAKVKAYQASTKGALAVDDEWLILAEVAQRWGWQAFLDVKNDARDAEGNLLIDTMELLTLLEASRRLDAGSLYDSAQAVFIGSAAPQAKNPITAFDRMTKKIVKRMKADNS